jgi:hypothetical protein
MIASIHRLPEWALLALAVWFFAGFVFYIFRAASPDVVKEAYHENYDWQNEVVHGLCLIGMVPMLSPMLLPVPNSVNTFVLSVAALIFAVRALTWGKRPPYWTKETKWWWDWAHVLILGGMAAMYAGWNWLWLQVPLCVFWTWLFGYYALDLVHEIASLFHLPKVESDETKPSFAKRYKLLSIGSDLSHGSMGLVMLLMTLFPASFMAHDMSTMTAEAVSAEAVSPKAETELRRLVFDRDKDTFLFIWGGCENCTAGAAKFDLIAKDLCSTSIRFVRVDKATAPGLCSELNIHECPVVLAFHKGVPDADRLHDDIDDERLAAFIGKHMRR